MSATKCRLPPARQNHTRTTLVRTMRTASAALDAGRLKSYSCRLPRDIVAEGALLVDSSAKFDRAPRRFSLADGLILMGALAISLERFRALRRFPIMPSGAGKRCAASGWSPWPGVFSAAGDCEPSGPGHRPAHGAALSGAPGSDGGAPLLRLRRPRPPFEQVVRQSGFVTCLMGIVVVAMLCRWGTSGSASLLSRSEHASHDPADDLAALALAPWRAEASWIDRLGRAVGWGWFAALAAGEVLGIPGMGS